MWIYGYVGCGKSALAQTVAEKYARKNRLAASFFFFRASGSRNRTTGLAATVASQLLAAIPAIEPYLVDAFNAHTGILTTYTLGSQFQHLVYEPLKRLGKMRLFPGSLMRTPHLIIIDGLDECNDRDEIAAFIDHMLQFFTENPRVPLRFLFTSRVEEHIRTRLESDQVYLVNLIDHTSLDDVAEVANATFALATRHDRVLQTYGKWPSKQDRKKLVEHSGGSLVFMSTLLKFIIGPSEDGLTPMERLPLALGIRPGLDGLYSQTLARSEHLPFFFEIVAAIIIFVRPPSILELAQALGIEPFQVVRVLVNLHSILHVPGDDHTPGITICHTSLRDYLLSEDRAGRFFISPALHNRVYGRVFTGFEIDSPRFMTAAAIALSLKPLSARETAILLDLDILQVSSTLEKISPLIHLTDSIDDPIAPCDESISHFFTLLGVQERMAHRCFAIIARPSPDETVTMYARSHAMDHWHSFLDPLPRDATLKDHLHSSFAQLQHIFSFEMRIVNLVLAILLTLSDHAFTVSPTSFISFLARNYFLPGEPHHATLIAYVLNSFAHHCAQPLTTVIPGLLGTLSAVWNPTPVENRALVSAHIALILVEENGHDKGVGIRDQTAEAFTYTERVMERSQGSPLFVSEFTKLVARMRTREGGRSYSLAHTIYAAPAYENPTTDSLYIQILGQADHSVSFLNDFLSTTAILEEPFTVNQLSESLKVNVRKIQSVLARLRGIIILPPAMEQDDTISLPPHFRDFLRDCSRAGRFSARPPGLGSGHRVPGET
jgi:hypothetical protein